MSLLAALDRTANCDSRNLLNSARSEPFAELQCYGTMAAQAKRANVFQVALSASFCHRMNVVGIPQAFAKAFFQSPEL